MSTVELGAVAKFVRGVTFKPDDVTKATGPDTVACMRTSNVQEDLETSDVWRIPRPLVKRRDQYLRSGDILVSSANSWNLVGKCCWVPVLPGVTTFGGFVSVLRAESSRLDPRYLYWWFSSPRIQQVVRSFGRKTTSISNLDLARCLRLDIPLPSIDEQRRVANVLDHCDEVRNRRGWSLVALESIESAEFADAFGHVGTNDRRWPTATLGSLASRFSDGPFGSNLKSAHYVESGVRVVRLQNIGSGEFNGSDVAYVSEDHFATIAKHECLPGDVLIATLGDPNIRACLLPDTIGRAVNKADCVQMRVDSRRATREYVVALLNEPALLRRAMAQSTGQTRTRISMGRLRELSVPVPPLEAQMRFSRVVRILERSKARVRDHLAELDALFGSLEHRAFTGAL